MTSPSNLASRPTGDSHPQAEMKGHTTSPVNSGEAHPGSSGPDAPSGPNGPGSEASGAKGQRLVRGGMLVAAASVAARAASFLAQLILGRLLLPEDFGVYAIALTFTTFAAAGNSVLRSFLVDALKRQWDFAGLYRLVMWTSLGVTAAAAAASPLLARPFGEEGLGRVLLFLFLAMPLQILPAFGASRLTNELRFRELSFMWTWSAIIRQAVTVAGALAGFGPIAFVFGVYAGSLAEVLLVRKHSGPFPSLRGRPKLHGIADLSELRWVPLSILVLALWINGDYASAGLFESAVVVGVYFFAYQLTTALTMPFTLAVSSILLPSFTSVGQDPGAADKTTDSDSFRLTVLLVPLLSGLPFGLLAVVAAPITHVVWGGEWDVAIEAIMLLGLVTPMKLLLSTSLSILQARGNWRGYTRLLGISAAVTVAAAALGGVIGGVRGLIMVIALANVVLGLWATAVVGRSFGLAPARVLLRPFSAWAVWLFAAGVTGLATPLLDVGFITIPFRVLVFLLAGLPLIYTLFGDELARVWVLGRRGAKTSAVASAPTSDGPEGVESDEGDVVLTTEPNATQFVETRPPGGWTDTDLKPPPPAHRSER